MLLTAFCLERTEAGRAYAFEAKWSIPVNLCAFLRAITGLPGSVQGMWGHGCDLVPPHNLSCGVSEAAGGVIDSPTL